MNLAVDLERNSRVITCIAKVTVFKEGDGYKTWRDARVDPFAESEDGRLIELTDYEKEKIIDLFWEIN